MPSLKGLVDLMLFRPPEPLPAAPEAPAPVVVAPAPVAPAPVAPPAPPVDTGTESDPKTRRTRLTPALVACISAACVVAAPLTQKWEGKKNRAYYDPAHIPTVCWGHTGKEVHVGMLWTDGQCHDVFTKDQQRLAIGAARCTPSAVIRNKFMMGSVVDFSFNGGPGLYCKSSMMRYFWQGNYAHGCAGYTQYIYATDKRTGKKIVLKGLVSRRDDERAMCMRGVK